MSPTDTDTNGNGTDSDSDSDSDSPHHGQPIVRKGVSLEQADAAVILCHGRGARAEGILALVDAFDYDGVTYLAPQAARGTWYPKSFLQPIRDNEPWLSSALRRVGDVIEEVDRGGVPLERIILGGFSQGACLATEYAARNARRYGGIIAFSGGLIGPKGTDFEYEGSMDGCPVFLGCSDVDPHIPVERVHQTRDAFETLGATVDERIYPNMGHTVNQDEINALDEMIATVLDT